MKIKEIIIEGYKEASTEFATNANLNIVQSTIEKYKQLVNKNQVTGNERNIDWWRKQGWNAFSKFVNDKSQVPTRTQIKRNQVVGKSITLMENNEWLIVIPIDKNASCFHGRNTDWCTAKTHIPDFEHHFYEWDYTLIYCLNKQTKHKWAILIKREDTNWYEIYNQKDNIISGSTFKLETGLDVNNIINIANTKQHQTFISSTKEEYEKSVAKTNDMLQNIGKISERIQKIEKELLFNKNRKLSATYLKCFDKIPEGIPDSILIAGIQKDNNVYSYNDLFKYIPNPSERVQMVAVKIEPTDLRFINNPSEKVLQTAVSMNGRAIAFIENPSEEVQIIAVRENWAAITDIKNPTEEAQLIAVKQRQSLFNYIKNPTPKVVKLYKELTAR